MLVEECESLDQGEILVCLAPQSQGVGGEGELVGVRVDDHEGIDEGLSVVVPPDDLVLVHPRSDPVQRPLVKQTRDDPPGLVGRLVDGHLEAPGGGLVVQWLHG